jgi:hypothetical protein
MLTSNFDWFFLLSANIFVLFCLFLIVSPWGSVRLGGTEATPDYGYPGWFAMLFAAGMGIGLMFFGVLEPAYYFGTPWGDEPLGVGAALRRGRRADRRQCGGGPAHGACRHVLSLGAAPLGDLRRGGAGAGALFLQQGPAAFDPLGLLPDPRGSCLGLVGPCYRHPGGLRDAVRTGDLAGDRRPAGQCGAGIRLWRAQQRDRAGDPDHRNHSHRARVGAARARWRRQGSVRDQHGDCRAAAALRALHRWHRQHPDGVRDRGWAPMRGRSFRCRTRSGARTQATCKAGRRSTGPGGSAGRPS